ncbi:unnamed protein product [Acanthoscelides obtectus]|nr:unnamed protein product [Acanthoscelides obtectus]CAK1664185.1 Uncharacterized protein CG7065 [Acanthoscelides obtectus]
MTKQYKRNWQAALQKIGEGIEKKFGRLKPMPIDKDKFEKDRMVYLNKISQGKHFSELSGYTFEELIVHDELTKNHDDGQSGPNVPIASDWVAIQKPFKRRSPSPPVVNAPKKKGDAGNKSFEPTNTISKPPGRKNSVTRRPERRHSLSSISSDDDDELGARRAGFRGRGGGARGGRGGFRPADRFGRNRSPIYGGRRTSPSPRHRSPSPRRRSPRLRRSPSPRRPRRDDPLRKKMEEEEREKEKLRKIDEYRKLSRAIENDMAETLKKHEKNPEKHPNYNEEWKKFWNRRYKELQATGVDASKYDFKPEWIEFWNRRMVELHSDEVRAKKEALRRRLALDEIAPIKFKIGPANRMPNVPMAALPDQDNEVIVIEDNKDDDNSSDRKRANSPWEKDLPVHRRSPKRRSPPRISPHRRSPPRRSPSRRSSPRRSPLTRSRSSERGIKRKSDSRSLSRDRSRSINLSPHSRDRMSKDRRSRSRERFIRGLSREDRGFGEHRSRERSWDRMREFRESSFERDIRGRERVRTVADLPWNVRFEAPPSMRDVRPPMMRDVRPHPEPPEDDDDDGEINVVDVLRILTALEDKLGSLGPKVIDLLAQALSLEKKEANSSETLLDNDINCVIFETVKEKLKGQLIAGLVDIVQERAFKKAIKKTAGLLHLASERKKKRGKVGHRANPVAVPGVGAVDKAAIARQIANALIAQGKTDVSQQELEQLINAVVGMAEASKNSNKPMTTAAFVSQISGGVANSKTHEKASAPTNQGVTDLDKLTEPLTPSPGRNSLSNMENLSDSDLQTLLQNFKDLSTDEQHNLINYLKKMELQEPERVEKLRQYVNLDPSKEEEDSKSMKSPFSNRFAGANPGSEDLVDIESDDDMDDKGNNKAQEKQQDNANSNNKVVSLDSDEEDYTFEDVVKSVSKTVKAKETETNKKIVEDTMKFASNKMKADENLSNAKDLISNLMSNINKSNTSDKVDLLGLGSYVPVSKSGTSDLLNRSDLTATLSNINMSNLASIMNSVKNFPSPNDNMNFSQAEQPLRYEPPNRISPDRRIGGYGLGSGGSIGPGPQRPMGMTPMMNMGLRGPARPMMGDMGPSPGGFGNRMPFQRPQGNFGMLQQHSNMPFSRGPGAMDPRMGNPRFGGYGNRW